MKKLARRAIGGERYAQAATIVGGLSAQVRRWKHLRPRVQIFDEIAIKLTSFFYPTFNTFFGYHDITPFSLDGSKILAIQTGDSLSESARIGWFSLDNPDREFCHLKNTNSWCWQQGCRLQWNPSAPSSQIFFNRIVDGSYGSELFDLNSGSTTRLFNRPIYAIHPSGYSALSLNFSRLQRLRPGYGYSELIDETIGEDIPKEEGIWNLDLVTGRADLLLSLDDIASISPDKSMDGAEHYLNHLSYSPEGNHILFFHLWRGHGNRYSRMFVINSDGTDLKLLSMHRSSHVCWITDEEVLAFTIDESGEGRYRCFTVGESDFTLVGDENLNADGHPMLSPNGRTLVLDSYPDIMSERSLSLLDLKSGLETKLGVFYSPPLLSGERRCDLHPRWDRRGMSVAVDSAHKGKRGLYILDLSL